MNNLFTFLTDIVINPKKQMAFAKQSDSVINAGGLSEAEKAIIESKISSKIAELFANETPHLAALCIDPSPDDPLPDPDPYPHPPSEPEPPETDYPSS